MCSSRSICNGRNRSNRPPSSDGNGSGGHYALCALGVGLVALGMIMILWTVIPMDGESSNGSTTLSSNSTTMQDEEEEEEEKDSTKSSTVAIVLIGVGVTLFILSIFLAVRGKRRTQNRSNQSAAAAVLLANNLPRQPEEPAVDPTVFNVPSYEEVIGSEEYPVRQSNLHHSSSQLPSYEDIIAAVENEGTAPSNNPAQDTPLNDTASAPAQPATEPQAGPPSLTSNPNPPTRSSSRASRLLRPLRVRRIKSDKLHLKDFRLQIRSPTQNPVTIEPITPPPQYENKMPEFE